MSTRIRQHIRGNILGYVAIFIALAIAPAWAASLKPNSVKSKHIKDGNVRTSDLGSNAVTSTKIGTGQVTASDLATDAVTQPKLAGNTVTTSKLANGAVTSAKVADNSLTGSDIAFDSLTGYQIDEGTLSGLPATGPAGGDLIGNFPNPEIADSVIGSAKVINDSLTGIDIQESTLGDVPNADHLDGLHANQFLRSDAAASGDLSGNYPAPSIKDGAVNSVKVSDNSLTGTDINESTLGIVNNSDQLDGLHSNAFLLSGAAAGGALSGTYPNPGIANSAIGTAQLGFNAVNSDKVADGSLTGADIDETTLGMVPNAAALNGFSASQFLRSDAAASGDLEGNYPAPLIGFNVVNSWKTMDNSLTGQDIQNDSLTGSEVAFKSLSSDDIEEATLHFWRPGGNSGVLDNRLGTLDDPQVRFVVQGAQGLRLQAASDPDGPPSPNVIGGMLDNRADGVFAATIGGGGRSNPVSSDTANVVTDNYGTIGGGGNNRTGDENGNPADREYGTIAGGHFGRASGQLATVGGGYNNTASGLTATVPGGEGNTAGGDYSFAAGRRAKNSEQGTFAWADSTDSDLNINGPNQFVARATGGVFFITGVDGSGNAISGANLFPGGGGWGTYSDRRGKRQITPISGRAVLRKLSSVPISTWSYRSQDPEVRHVGPMAQDFRRAFGVGESAKYINSLDADGVALAAIKGLNSENRELRRQVATLSEEVSQLGGTGDGGGHGEGAGSSSVALLGLLAAAMLALGALGGGLVLRSHGSRPAAAA